MIVPTSSRKMGGHAKNVRPSACGFLFGGAVYNVVCHARQLQKAIKVNDYLGLDTHNLLFLTLLLSRRRFPPF
jgi:hypothetical protein